MNQELFEKNNEQTWEEFEALLTALEKGKHDDKDALRDFPRRYRRACKHLALARDRRYSAHVVDRLNDLVMRGHRLLYVSQGFGLTYLWHFFAYSFPNAVRKEARLFWLCSLLFYGPLFGAVIAIQIEPEIAYSLTSPANLAQMESMYDPANREARDIGDDVLMFGFYIRNNTGIGFRTFGSGFVAGIGAILILLFNGISIGAAMGHLAQMPYAENFYTFVVGHGAFELTAIVLAGVAGFRLGLAWVMPGNLSRLQSMKEAGKTAITIVYGMGIMFILAAAIEAFWSPRQLAPMIKYVVGAMFWLITGAYFLLMGRRS